MPHLLNPAENGVGDGALRVKNGKPAPSASNGSAIISDDKFYRYRLERHALPGGGAGAIAWIMVNPSTADSVEDDQTIKKVIGFSERAGAGWLIVGNKFAFRSKDVGDLKTIRDPVGPDNDTHLRAIMSDAAQIVVAWGPLAKLPPTLRRRWYKVARIADELGKPLLCLGTAQDGHPRHPLMVSYAQPLVPWERLG